MTNPREIKRGWTTTEVTVWCGSCSEWDQQSGPMSKAMKAWRSMGWKRTLDRGWTCPRCLLMVKNDKGEPR